MSSIFNVKDFDDHQFGADNVVHHGSSGFGSSTLGGFGSTFGQLQQQQTQQQAQQRSAGSLGLGLGQQSQPGLFRGLPAQPGLQQRPPFGSQSSNNLMGLGRFSSPVPLQDDYHLGENDDFPALPSAGSNKPENVSTQSVLSGLLGRELGAVGEKGRTNSFGGNESQNGVGGSGLLANLLSATTSTSSSNNIALSKEMKFGLAGLLEIIRGTDKDAYALSLGMDPAQFGLNLNATEPLYPMFSSPFVENADEMTQKVPPCYVMQHPLGIKMESMSKFQLETLFYMFYQMPRDVFQALAAQELYKRDWRYHGELKIWLKPRTQQELLQGHPSVQFLFFDARSFETRLFNPPSRSNLLAGIVPEEEIRVKVPSESS